MSDDSGEEPPKRINLDSVETGRYYPYDDSFRTECYQSGRVPPRSDDPVEIALPEGVVGFLVRPKERYMC